MARGATARAPSRWSRSRAGSDMVLLMLRAGGYAIRGGPCHRSPAAGTLAACRWPPLPSARARIQDHHDGPWPHARTRPARPERPSARRRVCPSRQAAPLPATPSPVGLDRLRRALHHAAGPRAVLPVRRDRALRRQTATVGPARVARPSSSGSPRASRSARRARSCGSSTATSGCTSTGPSARGSAESGKQHATASLCTTTVGRTVTIEDAEASLLPIRAAPKG